MILTAAEAWFLAGVLLLIGEVVLPGVFLMWVGLAALGAGVVVFVTGAGLFFAVACFAAFTAVSIRTAVAMRGRRAAVTPVVNIPGAGLVGRVAVVVSVGPAGARVRVGDSDWAARGEALAVGAALTVRGVDGTVLIVG